MTDLKHANNLVDSEQQPDHGHEEADYAEQHTASALSVTDNESGHDTQTNGKACCHHEEPPLQLITWERGRLLSKL